MNNNHENERGSLPMFITIIVALAILGGGYIYLSSNSPQVIRTNGGTSFITNQQPVNPFNPLNSDTNNASVDNSNGQNSQDDNNSLINDSGSQNSNTNVNTQNTNTSQPEQHANQNLEDNTSGSVNYYNNATDNTRQQTNEQLLNSIQSSLLKNGSNLNGQNNTNSQDGGSTGTSYTRTIYDALNDSNGTSSGGANSTGSGSNNSSGSSGGNSGGNSSGGGDLSGMLSGITSGGGGNSSGDNNNNSNSNTKPFGGSVTQVTRCTCGPSSLIYIKSAGGGSGGGSGGSGGGGGGSSGGGGGSSGQLQLLYTPGQSKLYANYDINSTGENVVGTYTQGGSQCQVYSGTSCRSEGSPSGTISKVGTSQSQGI